MKSLSILVSAAVLATSFSVAAAPTSFLVPGSDRTDFNVICMKNGKETFSIKQHNSNYQYSVARNIVLTDMSGGRVAINFMYGSSSANDPGTYLTSADESCEITAQR